MTNIINFNEFDKIIRATKRFKGLKPSKQQIYRWLNKHHIHRTIGEVFFYNYLTNTDSLDEYDGSENMENIILDYKDITAIDILFLAYQRINYDWRDTVRQLIELTYPEISFTEELPNLNNLRQAQNILLKDPEARKKCQIMFADCRWNGVGQV